MTDTPRDCKHGRLARSCNICELERELAAMTKERDDLQKSIKLLTEDWAETDTYVQKIALKHFSEEQVYGDSYGVPNIEELVDMLAAELDMHKQEALRIIGLKT